MTLPPRAVLVHRRTELTELLERHGTRGQASFFLSARGRNIEDVAARHHSMNWAMAVTAGAVPDHWRRASVERTELPRFTFEPRDVIVVVGQDGLVANVAKYLEGQPVIGIDPEPGRNPGVLVRHPAESAAALLASAASSGAGSSISELCMVQAKSDDGQELVALNEIYLGHSSHQTARYELTAPGDSPETQASSGVIVGTGTGATGWCQSAWLERSSQLKLPEATERRLVWFVREAWPSPATGTKCTQGELVANEVLNLRVASDQLVVFGDGIESDAIMVNWGQVVEIRVASQTLRLVR